MIMQRRVLATDTKLGWEKKGYPFRKGLGPYRICDIEILSHYPDDKNPIDVIAYNHANHAYYSDFNKWRNMINGS